MDRLSLVSIPSNRHEYMKIAIVGMGYVGLPLSLQFGRAGITVIGLDIDPPKIAAINAGRSYIKHIPAEEIAAQVQGGRFRASADFGELRDTEAAIICVPTPLNKNREPDISFVLDTGRSIAPHLRRGMLVVLESTTYPGTTDEDLRAVLEKGSGLQAGIDFHLAFSPEREDPGNPDSKVALIPKVVGGLTPACRDRAVALYSRAVKTIVPVSSCRVAEATKLLENIFRSVNIALVNELKIVYGAMGIDIWEVIAAAKTKPFGFMPFYPGPGLGGHCIPIDPFYLTWKAREFGINTRFIELAGEVNSAMPHWVVGKVTDGLNSHRKSLNGSRVLVLGIAYKKNVDDMRESPAVEIMELLQAKGAEVAYHDPHVPVFPKMREHRFALSSIELTAESIRAYDCVLVATDHDVVDYELVRGNAALIVDTRRVFKESAPNIVRA